MNVEREYNYIFRGAEIAPKRCEEI